MHSLSHLRRRFWQKETPFEYFWLKTLPNRIEKKCVSANYEDEEMNMVCCRSSLIYLDQKAEQLNLDELERRMCIVSLLIWRLIWHNASRLSANELQIHLLLLCCMCVRGKAFDSFGGRIETSERKRVELDY